MTKYQTRILEINNKDYKIEKVKKVELFTPQTEIKEDIKGLYFKAVFSTSSHPVVAHARHIYKEGHAKGISIAGKFHFEDTENPNNLTLAEIYEISLVAVPADPNSLAQAMEKTLSNLEASSTANDSKMSLASIQKEIDNWIDQLTKKTS